MAYENEEKQKFLEATSDLFGAGRTGLKKGTNPEEVKQLLEWGKNITERDRIEQEKAGMEEYSRQRANLNYDSWKDVDPESPKELNKQLRYIRTIVKDPSSSVEGATHIKEGIEKSLGQSLTDKQTTNLLKVMGKAEAMGVRTDETTISTDLYKLIIDRIPDGEMTEEQLKSIVDDLVLAYKERMGYEFSPEEQKAYNEFEMRLHGETPKVSVHARGDGSNTKTTVKKASQEEEEEKPKNRAVRLSSPSHTRIRDNKTTVRGGKHGKFTEASGHKRRRKPTKKY